MCFNCFTCFKCFMCFNCFMCFKCVGFVCLCGLFILAEQAHVKAVLPLRPRNCNFFPT